MSAIVEIIRFLAYGVFVIFFLRSTLSYMPNLSPQPEKEDICATDPTENNYALGATGLHYLSNWQLCDLFRCGSRPPSGHVCMGADCWQANMSPLHEVRLEILRYAPGISYDFNIGEAQHRTIEDKVARHFELARFALAQLRTRFPISANTLQDQDMGKLCVDLPQFNLTVAEILPWHDLFYDWDQMLDHYRHVESFVTINHDEQLAHTHSYIRWAVGHVSRILEVRNEERFKQLVMLYEAGCGSWD
ncbi:hypothetical protein F4803DRAFT_556227 [Xylaria telfairii]|nr:hypothetical protein F4803DRAFT_556227 [Xylaria telfairii]